MPTESKKTDETATQKMMNEDRESKYLHLLIKNAFIYFILENISPAAKAAMEKLLADYYKAFLSPTTIDETKEKDQMESLTNTIESLTSSNSKGAYSSYRLGFSVFIV